MQLIIWYIDDTTNNSYRLFSQAKSLLQSFGPLSFDPLQTFPSKLSLSMIQFCPTIIIFILNYLKYISSKSCLDPINQASISLPHQN